MDCESPCVVLSNNETTRSLIERRFEKSNEQALKLELSVQESRILENDSPQYKPIWCCFF